MTIILLIALSPVVGISQTAKEWFQKGNKEGERTKRIESYTKAIELDSEHADAYYNRGLEKYALRQGEEALKDYDIATKFRRGIDNIYGSLTLFVAQASDEKMCHLNASGVIPENGPNEVKAIYLESPFLHYRCAPAARELG